MKTVAGIAGGAFSLFILVGMVSCLPSVSLKERERSFAPFQELKIGGASLTRHLRERSAFVIAVDSVHLDKVPEIQTSEGKLALRTSKHFKLSSACAIDRRGYLITAAHCLQKERVLVGIPQDGGTAIVEARVVFKGDPFVNHSDFAVLKVDRPLQKVFAWSPLLPPGSPAVSIGGTKITKPGGWGKGSFFSLVFMGGPLVKITEVAKGRDRWQLLTHEVPLGKGNSGGPLVATDGRLLGVNIEGIKLPPTERTFKGRAVRPDLAWLKRIIEQDARR